MIKIKKNKANIIIYFSDGHGVGDGHVIFIEKRRK